MSLDLETHMHSYIAPSVANFAEQAGKSQGTSAHIWLAHVYAVQRAGDCEGDLYETLDREALGLSEISLVEAIAQHAITQGQTTNTGRRVYVTDTLAIPFCSDDDMLTWHG